MHRPIAAIAALAALSAAARADVFFEITPVGQLPDGAVNTVRLLEPGAFDVYVWGSGPDTGLLHADFAVAAAEQLGWLLMDLGFADPFGQFTDRNHGAFGFTPDAILGISVRADSPVPLPSGPGSAMLLYQGFLARPDEPSALLDVYPVICTTNAGSAPAVHTIGLIATPAPSTAAALLAAAAVQARRRRPHGSV